MNVQRGGRGKRRRRRQNFQGRNNNFSETTFECGSEKKSSDLAMTKSEKRETIEDAKTEVFFSVKPWNCASTFWIAAFKHGAEKKTSNLAIIRKNKKLNLIARVDTFLLASGSKV